MKRILALVLLTFVWGTLFGQNKKVTILLKNEPIALMFQQIQAQTGYNVVYSNDVVSDTALISLSVDQVAVSQLLTEVLPPRQFFYRMLSDGMIVIGSRKISAGNIRVSSIRLSGLIVDQKGKPVPFGSLGLFDEDKVIGGSIASETGEFQLSYSFVNGKNYVLKVSSMGYEPLSMNFKYPDTALLKRIVLKEVPHLLKTVEVASNKPLVERKADRYVVNVEGSFLANGNNGLEVLKKSPGIWVGNDGSIRIRGNQSVMVMINDVVQRMSENDLAEYLRTLRSEDISKIEVIANPPSEFEAEGSGGIIHIVLKKSRRDGLIGTTSIQYRQQQSEPAMSVNMSLNYKIKSLYLSGIAGAEKDESKFIATNRITYPDQSLYASNTKRYNNNNRYLYRVGAGYDISKNQSAGIQSIGTLNKLNQFFETAIDFGNSAQPLTGLANSEWFRRPVFNGTTINYLLKTDTLGSSLKVLGDYIYSSKTELNNFKSNYTSSAKNSTYRNNTPNRTDIYSLQTDYTSNFRSGITFKTGLKFAATKRDNEVLNENFKSGEWVLNTNLSNRFIYKEYLAMAYTSVEKTFKKLSVKIGIRAENTTMDGNSITGNQQFKRSYLSLFPSVFLSQKFNEKKNYSGFFNYSRRLQRPSFADLNPYRLQFDDYLTQMGNPDLMPEYTHRVNAGATFWKEITAEVFCSFTTDRIGQLAKPISNNIIEYQPRNFDTSSSFGFSLYAPFKIIEGWNMNTGFVAYNSRYRLNDFMIRQTSYEASWQNIIVLKNVFDLDFGADYRSPSVRANTRYAGQIASDLGMSKRVMNKSLLIRFNMSDVFNSRREKDVTDYLGTTINFYQKRPTQVFSLNVAYTFSSGKKFNNKKIEQSNDEEKSRIGN